MLIRAPAAAIVGAIADEWTLDPNSSGKVDPDEVIADLADRQHGVLARAQLVRQGLVPHAIEHRLIRGRLRQVHRGVYAVGHRALSSDAHAMAAVLLGGPGAAMSHRAAAELLLILRGGSTFFEVTTPRRCRDRPHVRFHRARLPGDEVTHVRGIRVTTVPRTIFDLAGGDDRLRVERAMNEAEVRRLTDPLSVPDLMVRYPRHRGNATLRSILAAGRLGDGITRSQLEDRFIVFLDLAGIERPSLNVPVQAGGEWFEVDCLWRAQRLIVELDGHATHATRATFEGDRLRDRRLQVEGWRVVRITSRELHLRAERVDADLRAMLARAGATLTTPRRRARVRSTLDF